MGVSEKHQVDGGVDTDGKKWVIAGIPVRAPLKKIKTRKMEKEAETEDETTATAATTPTAEDAKIPERKLCPPPPRKKRPTRCNSNAVREFFNPPDLESVFTRSVET